jgi:hypothetical protein
MKFTFPPESRPLEGFTIKRAIYRGGFGEVYYGISDAGREVALKLLQNNSEVELRGVQQCLNLSHPNLVTIFDIRTDGDGDHWIVMEYIAGETLDRAIRRHPEGMPVEMVRKWLPGLVAGIGFLHSRGLVHRDLKPANVFMENGVVKVGDVGLSKFITPSRRSAQTQSVGTVYYMAPEVAKGRYGKEVDIYAVGVMLYEMLTGSVPFDGESTGEILMKHLTQKPDLSRLPPRLRDVIGKALNKDAEQRYRAMGDLERAFEAAILGKREQVPNASSSSPASATFVETTGHRPAGTPPCPKDRDSWGRWKCDPANWKQLHAWRIVPPVFVGLLLAGYFGDRFESMTTGMLASIVALGIVGIVIIWSLRSLVLQREPEREIEEKKADPAIAGPPARPRPISPAQGRLATFCGTAALAVPCVVLLSALLAVFKPSLFAASGSKTVDPGLVAFFVGTAVAGVWTLCAVPLLANRRDPRQTAPRICFAMAGILVGLAAAGLDHYLFVDLPSTGGHRTMGIFRYLGDYPLINSAGPTCAGYIAFFTTLFVLRNWTAMMFPNRWKRFRIGSVVITLFVTWMATVIFAFPVQLGLAWGAVLACAVQLVSPWNEEVPMIKRRFVS